MLSKPPIVQDLKPGTLSLFNSTPRILKRQVPTTIKRGIHKYITHLRSSYRKWGLIIYRASWRKGFTTEGALGSALPLLLAGRHEEKTNRRYAWAWLVCETEHATTVFMWWKPCTRMIFWCGGENMLSVSTRYRGDSCCSWWISHKGKTLGAGGAGVLGFDSFVLYTTRMFCYGIGISMRWDISGGLMASGANAIPSIPADIWIL